MLNREVIKGIEMFFSLPFSTWIRSNLLNLSPFADNLEWGSFFAIALWWTWSWHNEWIFKGNRRAASRVDFIIQYAKEVSNVIDRDDVGRGIKRKVEANIKWLAPVDDWVKLNSDGAVRNGGCASASGVIRDCTGRWIKGFVFNIGSCLVPCAELWGVLKRMRLAWSLGFCKVIVETDSLLIHGLICKGARPSHPLSCLVEQCQGFIRRNWSFQFRHIFREANSAADFLASWAFLFLINWFLYFG